MLTGLASIRSNSYRIEESSHLERFFKYTCYASSEWWHRQGSAPWQSLHMNNSSLASGLRLFNLSFLDELNDVTVAEIKLELVIKNLTFIAKENSKIRKIVTITVLFLNIEMLISSHS